MYEDDPAVLLAEGADYVRGLVGRVIDEDDTIVDAGEGVADLAHEPLHVT